MGLAYDLLFGDGLGDLQRDHARGQNAQRLDDAQPRIAIHAMRHGVPALEACNPQQGDGRQRKQQGDERVHDGEKGMECFHGKGRRVGRGACFHGAGAPLVGNGEQPWTVAGSGGQARCLPAGAAHG